MTNHYSQASCIMRFTRLFATLCVALFTLTACLEDHLPDIPKAEHRLTIAAAKTFFEASVATTRTTFADDPGITPGEFAPKWEQAKYTADTLIESVDVPIITGCSYRMTFTIRNEESGKRSTYSLPIYQKLIVVRNSRSDEMECFIMNLIPDKEYLIKNRSALLKKVFNGNFADYSGIVLYSQLKGNQTVRVDRYYAGRKIQTASVFDEALSLEQVQNRMQTLIQNASAKKTIRAVTRSESGGGFEGGTIPPITIDPNPEIPPVDPNPGEITPPVNPNPGGGGEGANPSNPPAVNIPAIIEKLKANSAVQKLFTKIKTDRIKVIPPPLGKEGYGAICKADGSIEFYSTTPKQLQEIVLLEELMHRYQKEQNNIHGAYKGNVEIEAKLLVWDYLRSNNSLNSIRGSYGYSWWIFGQFAENPNEETWKYAQEAIHIMGYDEKKYPVSDFANFKTDNYQNLK